MLPKVGQVYYDQFHRQFMIIKGSSSLVNFWEIGLISPDRPSIIYCFNVPLSHTKQSEYIGEILSEVIAERVPFLETIIL